jgi:Kef-type K+ transport system membrane component KefB
MFELEHVFHQVAALLAVSAVIAFIANRLRQPVVVGFIAAGIIVGPEVLGLVEETAELELLAEIGIALLLFVVGLKLDLRLVRVVGPVALATGIGQVVFTSAVGYVIAIALGFGTVPALYIAVALTFSSTIIIVKLLSDKGEIDDLHGRIAIGFLIVQDLVVVLAMIAITAVGEGTGEALWLQFFEVIGKGAAFLGGILVLMRWALPPLLHKLSRSPEVLVLFAIAWAVFLAAVGDLLGFSAEVGAFLGGVSLASTPYRDALGARLVSLRDFLLLFFFITLGAQLDFGEAGAQLGAAVVFSMFVLIGNPIIVMIIMGVMGYRSRVSFRAGLTVAQISEFSLILVALGFTLGHIDSQTVGLVTTVGLITIGLSTYLIYNSRWLYERFAGPLAIFEREGRVRDVETPDDGPAVDAIVFGLGRYGSRVVEAMQRHGWSPLGVDFDPQALREWEERGLPIAYGDAFDPHVVETLPLDRARWVVSTVRDLETNLALVQSLRQHGFRGKVALSALSDPDQEALEASGVDKILRPFRDAAEDAVNAIEQDRLADGGPSG